MINLPDYLRNKRWSFNVGNFDNKSDKTIDSITKEIKINKNILISFIF